VVAPRSLDLVPFPSKVAAVLVAQCLRLIKL
jgi:hypothetical protein